MHQLDEPLIGLLKECTVRISIKGQQGYGTGFFVASQIILTCKHVVEKATSAEIKIFWNNQFYDVITCELHFSYDIALLRVDIQGHPCVCFNEHLKLGDPLYSYGYTKDHPLGDSMTASFEGDIIDDDLKHLKFKEGQVRPGLSGAPLLNTRTGYVCGMIRKTRDRETDLGGVAIPLSALPAAYPDLWRLQHQFHRKVHRWRGARQQQLPQLFWHRWIMWMGGHLGKLFRGLWHAGISKVQVPGWLLIVFGVVIVAALVLATAYPSTLSWAQPPFPFGTKSTATPLPSVSPGAFPDLSEGWSAFDTQRPSGLLKNEAAQRLRANNPQAALADWNLALEEDPTDAETLIYQEDQLFLTLPHPSYFTLVVAVSLSPDSSNRAIQAAARDILQGVYVEQKRYNEMQKGLQGPQAAVLIANVRSPRTASDVAQEILKAQRVYRNIVGVIGWPPGSDDAIQLLSQAHIPVVSPEPLSDSLLGTPDLFSVVPSLDTEAQVAVQYSQQIWHPQQAILVEDPSDPYSKALATDFAGDYTVAGGIPPTIVRFATGYPTPICNQISQYLAPATFIYFAGYPGDVTSVLACVHSSLFPRTPVMGGDVLYQWIHSRPAGNAFAGLVFTAFAFHDEWSFQHLSQQPEFFADYKQIYGRGVRPPGGNYDYLLPDNDAIVGADAALALLRACQQASQGQQLPQPSAVQQALARFSAAPFVSNTGRQIAFAGDGTALDKTVLVLWIDKTAHTQRQTAIKGH